MLGLDAQDGCRRLGEEDQLRAGIGVALGVELRRVHGRQAGRHGGELPHGSEIGGDEGALERIESG